MSKKITPFLWFEEEMQTVVDYYKSIFPEFQLRSVSPMSAQFTVFDQEFMALKGGPHYTFNPAVSFFVRCKDQKEVDYYWDALIANGGRENNCGWLNDKYRLSWQIIPEALERYLSDGAMAPKVVPAMMKMQKIIVADLDRAAAA